MTLGRRGLGRRGVAVASAVAVVAAAGIAAAAIGFPHGDSFLAPAPASAAIVTLADKVQDAPPLTGDATLVQRSHAFATGKGFTGADLYLDDGRYFYAETARELPAAAKAGPIDYTLKPVMDAMDAAATADPQVARAAFLKAIDPQWGDDTQREEAWRQDNVIWCSGIDLLGAACGRPGVLSAMLRVFSTVDAVTVKHVTVDGHAALEISMKDPGSEAWAKIAETAAPSASPTTATDKELRAKMDAAGKDGKMKPIPPHLMTLTLDDQTGALLRYTDIGLEVTYDVTRVDAADHGVR
jgi:hypothetical protein